MLTTLSRETIAQAVRDVLTWAATEPVDRVPEEVREAVHALRGTEVIYETLHPRSIYLELSDGAGYRLNFIRTHPPRGMMSSAMAAVAGMPGVLAETELPGRRRKEEASP